LPPRPHRAVESNLFAFVLHPVITNVAVSLVTGAGSGPRSGNLAVSLEPVCGKKQKAVLLLNEISESDPAEYSFVAPDRESDGNAIALSFTGVKAADYLVRIQVDGAHSPLTVDTNPASPSFRQYIGPKVTIS